MILIDVRRVTIDHDPQYGLHPLLSVLKTMPTWQHNEFTWRLSVIGPLPPTRRASSRP